MFSVRQWSRFKSRRSSEQSRESWWMVHLVMEFIVLILRLRRLSFDIHVFRLRGLALFAASLHVPVHLFLEVLFERHLNSESKVLALHVIDICTMFSCGRKSEQMSFFMSSKS